MTEKKRIHKIKEKTCTQCGKSYTTKSGRSKYCSAKCSRRSHYLKNSQKIRERNKVWVKNNSDKVKEGQLNYYKNNKDKVKVRSKEWRAKNRESQNEWHREYAARNKEQINKNKQKWKSNNKHKVTEDAALRRARKRQAIPIWANQKYIALFYEGAKIEEKRTGKKVHVDHIIPLKHDLVCGLHCEDNMQLLFATDNIIKSNIFKIE